MEYKCKLISINKLNATPNGFSLSLCDSCKTRDCSNPIEKRKISILGVTKEVRVFSRGTDVSFVVACNGYTKE
jgi:hypothetical protein